MELLYSLFVLVLLVGRTCAAEYRQLSVEEYLNKMQGGWAGQMIGVAYGAPTEFKACGYMYEEEIRQWQPSLVQEALGQDDLYVELSFLIAIERYGLDITHVDAGQAFSETKFPLFHANHRGRENCRNGIAPPDSGSRKYNPHAADIDFQIQADLFGLINPGLPRSSNKLCEVFGRITNSGDGLYGGMFVAAMYTEAFFESNVERVVRQGLKSIPTWSTYARTIRDVLLWHQMYPDDWRLTWKKLQDKWGSHPSGYCSKPGNRFNIDASLNGAYVVIGLLYGNGELDKTLEITTRCGQDSDCNPSTAAGILCTILGYQEISDKYRSGIPAISDKKFAEVDYTWNTLIPTCERYARASIKRAGGYWKNVGGREVFFIPRQYPQPPVLERFSSE
ncbi:MAG: ADP-ribosylglycohydrolase family protein [Armatimonadota bacterium]